MTPDLAASFCARLSARGKERGEDFQQVLTRYGVERFLYRLFLIPAFDLNGDSGGQQTPRMRRVVAHLLGR